MLLESLKQEEYDNGEGENRSDWDNKAGRKGGKLEKVANKWNKESHEHNGGN